jgi:hypothetical protein
VTESWLERRERLVADLEAMHLDRESKAEGMRRLIAYFRGLDERSGILLLSGGDIATAVAEWHEQELLGPLEDPDDR